MLFVPTSADGTSSNKDNSYTKGSIPQVFFYVNKLAGERVEKTGSVGSACKYAAKLNWKTSFDRARESDIDFAISNVVVRNCRLASCCNGFKVGTGSWAPVKDILVENCRVERPRGNWRFRWFDEFPGVTNRLVGESAVTLGTVDGGSLENVTVRNMTFSGVATPISIRLNRRQPCRPGHETYSRNIRFENFRGTCEGTVPSQITGIPGMMVRNVVLKDVEISCPGGGAVTDDPVPERLDGYPGPTMFEGHTLPAYGFFLRHVDGIAFDNVTVRPRTSERRPVVHAEDVKGMSGDCR